MSYAVVRFIVARYECADDDNKIVGCLSLTKTHPLQSLEIRTYPEFYNMSFPHLLCPGFNMTPASL